MNIRFDGLLVYMQETIPNGVSETQPYAFGGLEPNTSHEIVATITYDTGSVTLNLTAWTVASRPDLWNWTNGGYNTNGQVAIGNPIKIAGSEWNNFSDNINSVRAYRGLSRYSFTYAYSGLPIYAYIYNQAVSAIKEIGGGAGGYLTSVATGDIITAYKFNILRSEINAVS